MMTSSNIAHLYLYLIIIVYLYLIVILLFISFSFNFNLISSLLLIYLAVPGLSCSIRTLTWTMWD